MEMRDRPWPQVKDKVFALRKKICNERNQCIQEAALEYLRRHPNAPPSTI